MIVLENGRNPPEGSLSQILTELRLSEEGLIATVQNHQEAAAANQFHRSRTHALLQCLFVTCCLCLFATIFFSRRSQAKRVKSARGYTVLHQPHFTATNRAELKAKEAILDSIRNAQSRYIATGDLLGILEGLLNDLLLLSRSDFGFISELLAGPRNESILGAHVIKNLTENEGCQQSVGAGEFPAEDDLRVANLLIGPVLTTKEPLIFKSRVKEFGAGSPWPDKPSLSSFMALPVFHDNNIVGIVGIANRPGGYHSEMAHFLVPMVNTCGQLFHAFANERRQRKLTWSGKDSFF